MKRYAAPVDGASAGLKLSRAGAMLGAKAERRPPGQRFISSQECA